MTEFNASRFARYKNSALVIAHPGHELRVYRWLELARPTVFILTDGSGRSGKSRLDSSAEILYPTGARSGSIFGRLTDAELYRHILAQDSSLFVELAYELANNFYNNKIEYVVGDAIEGYNPAHDLCRLIINAAMMILEQEHGFAPAGLDFLLSGAPDLFPEDLGADHVTLHLSSEDFERKLQAARSYPELQSEIESAVNKNGIDAFRTECLRLIKKADCNYDLQEPPFYERYGAAQVAAGFYARVIKYSAHMIPLAEALGHCTSRSCRAH